MYSKTQSTLRRGFASLLFIAALLSAFAAPGPDVTPAAATTPAVNPLQGKVDELNAAVDTSNKVLPLLQQQRNALAAQVQDYQVQLTISQNTATELQTRLKETHEKLEALQSKYDMEKAKVEAILKKHPGEAVAAQQTPVPEKK